MPAEPQTTLKIPCRITGHGIHSGQKCHLDILPAPADYGVRFVRTDLENAPEIPADISVVSEEPLLRQTILCAPQNPDVSVQTVEHVLATLHAMQVDNARVEMNGPEAPIGDGSAKEVAQKVMEAKITIIPKTERRVFRIDRPIAYSPPDSSGVSFAAWPSQHLTITYFLDYDHPVIGTRTVSMQVDPETFANQIAPARTFCTYEEVEYLRAKGLIQGGNVENAIVVGREGILNTELLWEDELARHKMLDLIGDLLLIGLPVRGHILAHRAGHHSNAQFIQYLRREFS